MAEPVVWRTIEDLAHIVGHYCWIEHRVFEVAGAGAAVPAGDGDGDGAGVRVWCAAVSRRHGDLARAWAERLPVRAGVDAAALVGPPPGGLAGAFATLAALTDPVAAAALLVGPVLGGLGALYAHHLETASAVSEASVAEVLVAARGALAAERASGEQLLQGMRTPGDGPPGLRAAFERSFEEIGILPAVRPS